MERLLLVVHQGQSHQMSHANHLVSYLLLYYTTTPWTSVQTPHISPFIHKWFEIMSKTCPPTISAKYSGTFLFTVTHHATYVCTTILKSL